VAPPQTSVRSRNLRLAGLRAFLKFAARRDVSSLHVIERALGVPMKRFDQPILGFLSRDEMVAVMGQPGDSWTSQRGHLLLVRFICAMLGRLTHLVKLHLVTTIFVA
jgi:hypothetical protein